MYNTNRAYRNWKARGSNSHSISLHSGSSRSDTKITPKMKAEMNKDSEETPSAKEISAGGSPVGQVNRKLDFD